MSALVERQSHHGARATGATSANQVILAAIRRQRGLILTFTVAFPLLFYTLLMALLVARFGQLPNYVTPYNWLGNIAGIVAGTSSLSDVIRIGMDEWLLEIGSMNHAYGNGVSEWSLLVIPHKLAIMMGIGALVGLNFALLADQPASTSVQRQHFRSLRSGLLTSIGALCASLTGVTLYWVICHSGPTWVVSLTILGIDLETARALEPIGPAISLTGAALLVLSALWIVRDTCTDAGPKVLHPAKDAAPC
jgi:hypothetical protein